MMMIPDHIGINDTTALIYPKSYTPEQAEDGGFKANQDVCVNTVLMIVDELI